LRVGRSVNFFKNSMESEFVSVGTGTDNNNNNNKNNKNNDDGQKIEIPLTYRYLDRIAPRLSKQPNKLLYASQGKEIMRLFLLAESDDYNSSGEGPSPPKSQLVSSNLRRAVAAMAVGFQNRLKQSCANDHIEDNSPSRTSGNLI
jgi:hypothetical protein